MVMHEAEMAKKNDIPVPKDRIDWLAKAVVNLRGITPAAKALKVPKKTICASHARQSRHKGKLATG
jgi:hypothetical protein